MIDYYRTRKGLEKADVWHDSGLAKGYAYEIMSGKSTKNISRDKVIGTVKNYAQKRLQNL